MVGFSQDFGDLPISVQRTLFGLADELDATIEALRAAQQLPVEDGRILQRLPRAQNGYTLPSKVAKPYNPADYPDADEDGNRNK